MRAYKKVPKAFCTKLLFSFSDRSNRFGQGFVFLKNVVILNQDNTRAGFFATDAASDRSTHFNIIHLEKVLEGKEFSNKHSFALILLIVHARVISN